MSSRIQGFGLGSWVYEGQISTSHPFISFHPLIHVSLRIITALLYALFASFCLAKASQNANPTTIGNLALEALQEGSRTIA